MKTLLFLTYRMTFKVVRNGCPKIASQSLKLEIEDILQISFACILSSIVAFLGVDDLLPLIAVYKRFVCKSSKRM